MWWLWFWYRQLKRGSHALPFLPFFNRSALKDVRPFTNHYLNFIRFIIWCNYKHPANKRLTHLHFDPPPFCLWVVSEQIEGFTFQILSHAGQHCLEKSLGYFLPFSRMVTSFSSHSLSMSSREQFYQNEFYPFHLCFVSEFIHHFLLLIRTNPSGWS